MKNTAQKLIIETSAVLVTINETTPQHHCEYIQIESGARVFSSYYIRKEFLEAFFCEIVKLAVRINASSSVQNALLVLPENFKIRQIKVHFKAIIEMFLNRIDANNPQELSEEIARYAFKILNKFDDKFAKKIINVSGCSKGRRNPKIDYNDYIGSLHEFYMDYKEPVKNCQINDFLGFKKRKQSVSSLLSKLPEKIKSATNLKDLLQTKSCISCNECRKIGDLVISLEQPADYILVHIDNDFSDLCKAQKKENIIMLSLLASEKKSNQKT